MIEQEKIVDFRKQLVSAEKEKKPIPPISERIDLNIKDAYKIQHEVVNYKADQGGTIVGKKIGLTNKKMQNAFGIDQPDYGRILDDMVIREGSPISISELIQPRIEVEIAFLLKEEVEGPGVTSPKVLKCTEGIIPSFEVIDSRIEDWNIEIQDTIADNASGARLIMGSTLSKTDGVDLKRIGVVVRKNGEIIETAAGAGVLGNPTYSVAWLANKLGEYDETLKSGEIILSGSMISPIGIENGDVFQAEFGQDLGTVSAYVKD